MTRPGALITAAAVLALTSLSAAPASAKPAYSCKRDKIVDAPMQFTAAVVGNRVRLSAFGGSDKSGWVAPYNNGAWKVFDASGTQVTRFTESLLAFASTEMLKESHLEGLLPGTYTIRLTSFDLCGNQGTFQRSVTIAEPVFESTPPTVTDLQPMQLSSFGAAAWVLYFSASDNTGIKRVIVEADGSLLADFSYYNGTSYRWWTEFFPDDSTVTAFEGPVFYIGYDSAYRGRCGVRVTAEDVSGNRTTATGDFCLP